MSHLRKLGGAALVAALVSTPTVATAQSSSDVSRTAWGDPDLGGVYDYSSITPMVRPERYGDQAYLTVEEAAELEAGAVKRDKDAAEAPITRSVAGDRAGAGSHSFVWGLELGTQVVEDRRTSRISDPPNGRYPALTAWGEADRATRYGFADDSPADDYSERGWGDRCLAIHGMPISPLPYNSFVQIFQTPDHVAIFSEAFRIWRIVPLDGGPHGTIRQWLGDTRGRWEGDTLVVETTNFSNYLQQGWFWPEHEQHGREIHACESRRDPVRIHRGRSGQVGEPLDRRRVAEKNRPPGLRGRLSRGELRHREHSSGCTRAGWDAGRAGLRGGKDLLGL